MLVSGAVVVCDKSNGSDEAIVCDDFNFIAADAFYKC